MKNLTEETIVEFVEERIREGSVINTDRYSSYAVAFADGLYSHHEFSRE
jgi:transposase-like protein